MFAVFYYPAMTMAQQRDLDLRSASAAFTLPKSGKGLSTLDWIIWLVSERHRVC